MYTMESRIFRISHVTSKVPNKYFIKSHSAVDESDSSKKIMFVILSKKLCRSKSDLQNLLKDKW